MRFIKILYIVLGEFAILNFKINIILMKIFLILIIVVFFLPFFSVSCTSQDTGITFSGFELSAGKNINGYQQDGNFLGFILIIPPVILLALFFFIRKIKSELIYNICKNIFFILPMIDIFIVFIIRYMFTVLVKNKLGDIPADINTKYGFWFYVILNAAIFALAVINYFTKRE